MTAHRPVGHADDVAGHQDRVVVAGAGGVGVGAEDAPVNFALVSEADDFNLAFEQAFAAGEVDTWLSAEPWRRLTPPGLTTRPLT